MACEDDTSEISGEVSAQVEDPVTGETVILRAASGDALDKAIDQWLSSRYPDLEERPDERLPNRTPYVWSGDLSDPQVQADGCRRSAEIDRTEAEGYSTGSAESDRCLASAQRWDQQAAAAIAGEPGPVDDGSTRPRGRE